MDYREQLESAKLVRDAGLAILLASAIVGAIGLQSSLIFSFGLTAVIWIPLLVPLFLGLLWRVAKMKLEVTKDQMRVHLAPLFLTQVAKRDISKVTPLGRVAFSDNFRRVPGRSFAVPFGTGAGVLIETVHGKALRIRSNQVVSLQRALAR